MKKTILSLFVLILVAISLYMAMNDSGQFVAEDDFEQCIKKGGKDITPEHLTLRKCVLDNRIYESNCVSNSQYFVVKNNLTDSAGSDILVKNKQIDKQEFNCEYKVDSSDLEIKNESAEYVLALENNYLILDSGTGPHPRGLIIHDLTRREKVFEDEYLTPIKIKDNIIDYWTTSLVEATKENCSIFSDNENSDLTSAIDTHVKLDLSTLKKTELGESRCTSRQ